MIDGAEWLEMVPAARRLGIPVRAVYDAVDQGVLQARWAGSGAWSHLEVALDVDALRRLSARAD